MYDIFFSYPHADKDEVMPICSALQTEGLDVWIDKTKTKEGESITRSTVEGLAQSKVLLAYYSPNYPRSRACQWELTAAFLAAQHEEGDPRRRIQIIKPKGVHVEIHPVELADALYHRVSVPVTPDEICKIVESVKAHVEGITSVFGDIGALRPAEWYGGRQGTGSNRFVGRLPHMWKIHSGLHESEYPITAGTSASHAPVVRVYGMGGVGKSLLAEEYALRYGAAFPGGVFWLSAFGNDDTKTGMSADEREAAREGQIRQIATTLGITVEGRNPDEIEVALRLELGRREKSFLWVVDDLPSGTDRETFERWLAPHSLGKTLITTRAKEHDALGTLIPLDVLEPEEAYELLTSRRKPRVEGDRGRRRRGADEKEEEFAACDIVEALGCHALAVDVAGAALYDSSSRTPFVTFLEDLADPTDDALEFAADLKWELPTGHEASIASTFLRSIDRLESEGLDFLRLASMLAVAPIPATLISSVFSLVDSLDERSGRRRADLAVSRAEKLSLAERANGDAGAWSVHTLISRTMRFRDPKPERSEELRDAAVRVLTTAFRVNAGDPRDHAALELVVAHARELADGADDLKTADLAGWVARYDLERGEYGLAERLYRREWETRRRVLGKEHPSTLTSIGNLAVTLRAQGELAGARKIQEEVLEICRHVLGNEHPDTLRSMNNLAGTLHAQGELAGARKTQEEVLEMTRRILGSEHPSTLTSMSNLAATLHDQGDLAGARKIQEEEFEITRRILGEEHPSTLASMSNLAATLKAHGDLDGAREIQEEVLEISRRVLGKEHPGTLKLMNNLAAILHEHGDLAGARKIQEEVLEIRRRILGEEHPGTSISAWTLLTILVEIDDPARARTVLENDLLWLLDRDPASLGADQRRIREWVKEAMG